jgi:hypothetical protein
MRELERSGFPGLVHIVKGPRNLVSSVGDGSTELELCEY